MPKRNAHAVAALARKAGAHVQAPENHCTECGKGLGFGCPTMICWPCEMDLKFDYGDAHGWDEGSDAENYEAEQVFQDQEES